MKKLFVLVSLITCMALLIGCASKESRISGQWHEKGSRNKSEYIEFFSDKTVTLATQGMSYQGTWSILDDGRVKADVTILWAKQVILGDLNGNTLTLDISGHKGTFEKK